MQKSFLIVLVVVFSGCGWVKGLSSHGTETGNAITPTSGNLPVNVPAGGTNDTILSDICNTLVTCHTDMTLNQCETAVGAQCGLAQELGVSRETGIKTLLEIMSAESTGQLVENKSFASSCRAGILALTCDDPAVAVSDVGGILDEISACSLVF